MTVCIAAFADSEERIAITADSKVAFGDFSTDQGAIKYELLGQRYLALIAGNDVVYASPTIRGIQKQILETQTRDADEVAEIVQEQLCETRNRIIESKVLKKYKLTVADFVSKGRAAFSDQVYYDICSRIDREDLSLQFLVAGFDAADKPHLRIITADEPPNDYDSLGFAAIGTGAPAALASLAFARDHCAFSQNNDPGESAYFLLGAKFMAESARDVGQETVFMSISAKHGVQNFYDMGTMNVVRKMWLSDGAPRRSKRTIRVVQELLYSGAEGFFDPDVMQRAIKYVRPSFRKALKLLIAARIKDKLGSRATPKQLGTQTSKGQQ